MATLYSRPWSVRPYQRSQSVYRYSRSFFVRPYQHSQSVYRYSRSFFVWPHCTVDPDLCGHTRTLKANTGTVDHYVVCPHCIVDPALRGNTLRWCLLFCDHTGTLIINLDTLDSLFFFTEVRQQIMFSQVCVCLGDTPWPLVSGPFQEGTPSPVTCPVPGPSQEQGTFIQVPPEPSIAALHAVSLLRSQRRTFFI